MKTLKAEFICNADGCGNHTFRLVKRDGMLCMYERIRLTDKSTHSFEVFITRVVKAGTSLPGGGKVEEDYEQYPGKSLFGRTAYSLKQREWAEAKYVQLLGAQQASQAETVAVPHDETAPTFEPFKYAVTKSYCIPNLPDDEFVIQDAVKMNPSISQGRIYIYLQASIKSGTVLDVGLRAGVGRGKPARVYKKV